MKYGKIGKCGKNFRVRAMKLPMRDLMSTKSKEAQPWFAPTGEILDYYLSLLAKTVSIFF